MKSTCFIFFLGNPLPLRMSYKNAPPVIMPILLFNMLIAMMGNTYAIVSEKSEKEFLKQWARVIMSIERAVSVDKAKEYLEQYSMKMGENLRGVMVIKTKDKSRASQRKGAVANWKKTGKTVNRYLKKRKITGRLFNRKQVWLLFCFEWSLELWLET